MRDGSPTHSFAGISLLAFALVCFCSSALRAEDGEKASNNSPQSLSEMGRTKTKVSAGADSDLSADELHDKQMKKLKLAQEKAIKQAEDQAKKNKKKDDNKESKEESDPTAPKAIARKNAKLVELEPPKDGKKKSTAEVVKNTPGGSNLIEIGGPNTKIARQRGTTAIIDERAGETALSAGETNALNIKDPPGEKRGFIDRLFGRDKKAPTPGIRAAKNGEEFKIVSDTKKKNIPNDPTKFMPAPSEHHDTLSHKVQEMMAIKRLDGESKDREKEQPADKTEKKAEVVDLAPGTEPAADPNSATAKPGNDGDEKAKPAEKTLSEAEVKAAMEQQYRAGLASRDVVAREASYQRAAIERREDAIPFLLEELKQDNLLAAFAVQCLGAIGKLSDDVEIALIRNLASHRAPNRQACAENLGRLHSRRAVQSLIESFKVEKSYQVRQAELDALGFIGERNAGPFLKSVLEQKDEIETVKSSAALALARMGDPSGRAHLIRNLDSPMPAMQVLAIMGLSQLREPFISGYLNKALESPYEEVWTTAVYLFPLMGPVQALPVLRTRLDSPNDTLRRRAALAMGFLGSDEAVPFIDRSLRVGTMDERVMGCALLGVLQRKDRVPLLIEKLQDPNSDVRQAAAVALTRLNATEALPAMIECSRGVRNMDLPPALRGAGPEYMERLVILSCVRVLRGEKEEVEITTLPSTKDNSWPEVDRLMTTQQKELVKLYQLVDVIGADGHALGAVLKGPDGKEIMFKEGEPVASGFKIRDIGLPMLTKDKTKMPPYVILMRGDDRITLIAGKPAEEDSVKPDRKK